MAGGGVYDTLRACPLDLKAQMVAVALNEGKAVKGIARRYT